MKNQKPAENSEFDAYAADYDTALARGLGVTGEAKEYYASRRVEWLFDCLRNLGVTPDRILDFGCGTGSSAPFLLGLNTTCSLEGVDISTESIAMARKLHGSARAEFFVI